jgi:hypothetical protein
MKRFAYSCTLSAAVLFGVVALTGCGGNFGVFPDTTTAIAPGAIHGSVYGGHAPVTGAHVYVLQAGEGSYGAASVSKITSGFAGSDANGNYVLTDAGGNFNITGDYSCDYSSGFGGHPVYLAAKGGSVTQSITSTFSTSTALGTGAAFRAAPYTLTFASNNLFYAGQSVSFPATGQPGALTGYYSPLNGSTQTVTASTPTQFSVVITATSPQALSPSVVGTSTGGSATPVGNNNPAIVNLAVLGNCPGTSGEFADTLRFVFMNEVSTVAAAQALGGFGTGPFNIGATTANLVGIQNATLNAGQLYDIQGGNFTNSAPYDGEGHIARSLTPSGNGQIPTARLDTLGNILASCVDSNNTANSAGNPAASGASINCAQLFTYATSNGIPYNLAGHGTVPTDTTTAAFNIAHFPAGSAASTATFMSKLFALQGSQAIPFSPSLASAPNDFTIAITYPNSLNTLPSTSTQYLGQAESLGVDAVGNVWFSAQTQKILFKWSPQGVLQNYTQAGYIYGYLSVDPSGDAWSGNANSNTRLTEVSPTGVVLSNTPPFLAVNGYLGPYNTAYTTITDQYGDAFVCSKGLAGDSYLTTVFPNGALAGSITLATGGVPSTSDTAHGAYDNTGALWLTSEAGSQIDRINLGTVPVTSYPGFPITFGTRVQPEFPGIDNANNAWIAIQYTNTVEEVSPTGVVTPTNGASLSAPFGSAVDGLGNVWIANRGNNSIVEFNNSNATAISPTTNYTLGSGTPNDPYVLSDSLNLAVDPSGDIWITNYGGGKIVELIGPAAPVVTPLSLAAGAGTLGTEP